MFGNDAGWTRPAQPALLNQRPPERDEPLTGGQLSPLTANLINEQIERLAKSLSDATLQRVEHLGELWRSGKSKEGFEQLKSIKADTGWKILSSEARFRVLRLEASLVLNTEHTTEKAKEVIQEAIRDGPRQKLQGLEALVAFRDGNPEAALEMVANPFNVQAWNVRLAIVLETGKWVEAVNQYSTPPAGISPDAESKRLLSLCLLQQGDVEAAVMQGVASARVCDGFGAGVLGSAATECSRDKDESELDSPVGSRRAPPWACNVAENAAAWS